MRIENWFRCIVAEEVAKAASPVSNDVLALSKASEAFQVEALRLLNAIEQTTPPTVKVANKALLDMRDGVTGIANLVERLHPKESS